MRKRWLTAGLALAVAFAATGLAVSTSGAHTAHTASSKTIVIGATIPLTGSFAAFGAQEKIGDNLEVSQINNAGGIKIGGVKEKVKVIFLDNQSLPNLVTSEARTLILQDHAVGLFGTITPPLVIPLSEVADQLHVPMVHHTPIQAWLSGSPSGYSYSWDVFFNEPQMTTTQFLAADEVKTNKKVVLFTDTDPDGVAMGALWETNAPKYGYTIAARESFASGTTDYSSYIAQAKADDAQILIAQMDGPDAVNLWKQMKADGYQPQVAVCEKCAYTSAWESSFGAGSNIGTGTMVADIFSPSYHYPDAALLVSQKKYFGGKINPGVSGVAEAFTCSQILLKAIAAAGSTSGPAINAALAKTNYVSPLGPIKFTSKHYDPIKAFQTQWTANGTTVVVWPKKKGGASVTAPVSGLG
jgi:branched-chain amino acid transport system substrate-binding protein